MPYSVKGFYEINEDMVQILLMLEVLFTRDSKVEDLFYGAHSGSEINEDMVQILLMLEILITRDSKVEEIFYGAHSGSEPSMFFSNYLFSLGFSLFKMTFSMTLLE